MPNDAPFATPPPTPPPAVGLDPAAPAPNDPTPAPSGADPQAAARVLQEAIRGAVAPVVQRMEQLEQRLAAPPQPTPTSTTPPAGTEDWIDKVANRDALRDEVMGWVREAVGPALLPIAEATREQAESRQIAAVDDYYGPGTWDEVVKPRYEAVMGELRRTNPTATFTPQNIQTIVDSIVGSASNRDTLMERRAKMEQQRQAQRAQAPRFVGPGRPMLPSDTEIADEDRDIISRIQRSLGKDAFSESDLIEARKARGAA